MEEQAAKEEYRTLAGPTERAGIGRVGYRIKRNVDRRLEHIKITSLPKRIIQRGSPITLFEIFLSGRSEGCCIE